MYSTIYYPHTTLGDSPLLKTALLLWDQLEFIVPDPGFPIRSSNNAPDVDEALEIIGIPHFPSVEERTRAHELVVELANSTLPKDFLLETTPKDDRYLVYPQKFLPETWDHLRNANLAIPENIGGFDDWAMSRNLGLTVMSILAESCAGIEKRTATDKITAYNVLNQSIAQIHGGGYSDTSTSFDRLVTISVNIINPDEFTLRELIDFRKKEKSSTKGNSIRELRHNYLAKIDEFVTRVSNGDANKSDVREIERQFEQKMKDDLVSLKGELKRKATDVLLSKEVGIGILAMAGVAVTPWTIPAGLLGIGALIHKAKSYRQERRDILSKHAMSWLFQLGQTGLLQAY